MRVYDKIIANELQKITDVVYHFSMYENELILMEFMTKHILDHVKNHFQWEKPWFEF